MLCMEPGKMCSTKALDRFEIYIPEKAEVKNIKLEDLPKSTLQKMKLHPFLKGSTSQKDLASVMATWISPVALREKGQWSTSRPVDAANNSMMPLATTELKAVHGPFPMPVISSSTTAFNVLMYLFCPKSSECLSPKTPQLPFGSPPRRPQDAIILYCGRIYLSVKKPFNKPKNYWTENRALPAPDPSSQQVSKSELLSPDDPKSQAFPPSPRPPVERSQTDRSLLHRFGLNRRLLVSLTKISPEYMKGLVATRQQTQAKTQARCREEQSREENAKIESEESADFSVQLQGSVEEQDGRSEATEDSFDIVRTTGSEPNVEQLHTGPGGALNDDTDLRDNACLDPCSDMDVDEPESRAAADDDDYAAGMVPREDDGRGWTATLPQGPAFSSSQGQEEDFDFELLAREEAISRIRAQLREREAALSDVRHDDCSV